MNPLYHERFPNTPGIYRITCVVTGKIYIGSAVNLRVRRKTHYGDLQRNAHHNRKLQNAWKKYGPDTFVFDILELVMLPEMLTAREQYWFKQLNPFGKRGFNLDPIAGSSLGVKYSQESRARISAAKRGKPTALRGRKQSPEQVERHRQAMIGYKHTDAARRNMGNARRGKQHSPETRAKISKAALGHVMDEKARAHFSAHNEASKKTLIVTAPDGTEYLVHGVSPFCKAHGLHPGAILDVANGKYKQYKGWIARYP